MDSFDFAGIEKKWQAEWGKAGVSESDVLSKPKKYITAAFPYPNSPQHIGHARTYTTTDIYARYLRMLGNNVLFPMAFHVTGTPILAMAKRIAANDEEIYGIFERIYEIPREKTKTLADPKTLVMHFSKEIEVGMREMGYAIDWRRKFYTFDPSFAKFIQWQFRKLKENDYLVQGEHPVAFCPNDKQAVGAHDTKGDVDPEIEEFTCVKFQFEDGHIATATLRPETISGVSSLWINPDSTVVKAEVGKDILYITKEAADKLAFQNKQVKILKEMRGKELIGKKCKNPITGHEIEILPASFVDPAHATGMVMSVPAHAPYDFLAIRDYSPEHYQRYLIQVLEVNGFGNFPAKEICEKLGIKNQDDPRAEEATKEIYRKEAHGGIMHSGKYKGEKVLLAKDKIKEDMLLGGSAFQMYEMDSEAYCRCGARVVVSVLGNQWFIDYSKQEWKDKARECLDSMSIVPEKTRQEYLYAIGWFKQKACARSQGLGTRFPFDEKLVIEALSDSTIYMAYYTIAHMLGEFKEEELDEGFFDSVFLGKEIKHKKDEARIRKLRESFLYWYPLDSRHSGADLVRNHLPFFIFTHVAVFEKKFWPRQIVTNGFVLMEGRKMSKSLANILPLRKAVAEYGADVIRFSVVGGADLTQDTDFNKSVADGTRSRLKFIFDLVERARHEKAAPLARTDRWILSRLNRKAKLAKELYSEIRLRELGLEIFYDFTNGLHWYLERSESVQLKEVLKTWALLISPFMPHLSEEIWHALGGKGLAVNAHFPEANEKLIDEKAENEEGYVKQVLDDAEKIASLVLKDDKTKTLKHAEIYVAALWKKKLYEVIRSEKAFDKVMKACSQDAELKPKLGEAQRMIKQLTKNAYALPEVLAQKEETEALTEAKAFLEKKLKCTIAVVKEEAAKDAKAQNAIPGKPAIKLVIG